MDFSETNPSNEIQFDWQVCTSLHIHSHICAIETYVQRIPFHSKCNCILQYLVRSAVYVCITHLIPSRSIPPRPLSRLVALALVLLSCFHCSLCNVLDICFQLPIFFDVSAKYQKLDVIDKICTWFETTKHISKNVNSHCVSLDFRFHSTSLFPFDAMDACLCCTFSHLNFVTIHLMLPLFRLSFVPKHAFSHLCRVHFFLANFSFPLHITFTYYVCMHSPAKRQRGFFVYTILRLDTSHLNKTIYQIDINSTDSDL